MRGGATQFYVYWRTTRERVAPAAVALRDWHASLVAVHPALRPRLLVRHEPARSTVMEVYTSSGAGIDGPLRVKLADEGDVVTAAFRNGPRKVEIFEPLD